MPTASTLPETVDRWVAGWAAVRRLGAPTRRRDGVVEVEVGRRGRRLEWILAEPDEEAVHRVWAELAATDDVWLTVFASGAPGAAAVPVVPAAVTVLAADESLMHRTLAPAGSAAPGRSLVVEDGDRASATVWLDEVAASRGWAGIVGADAVFDRIETDEVFRRRGLGSEVMGGLEAWAVDRGATDGLLAATVAGQALYTRLGWRVVASMTTFTGAPARPAR